MMTSIPCREPKAETTRPVARRHSYDAVPHQQPHSSTDCAPSSKGKRRSEGREEKERKKKKQEENSARPGLVGHDTQPFTCRTCSVAREPRDGGEARLPYILEPVQQQPWSAHIISPLRPLRATPASFVGGDERGD